MTLDKQSLIDFEAKIATRFNAGELPYLVHFSGGNEDQLIEIFKGICPGDYVFSSHRSHYHYLLAGGSPERLEALICNGRSMFVFDRKLNFYASSIVCGTASIAAGVAWALKRKGDNRKVWCFLGDGGEDEGHLYEAARYVDGWGLPCTFVIEDNDRSVFASKKERWGEALICPVTMFDCVLRYSYVPTHPHGGSDSARWLQFSRDAIIAKSPKRQSSAIPSRFGDDYCWDVMLRLPKKYSQAVKESMEMFADKINAIFIGYNVRNGAAYGALTDVPESQRLETPVAENLMAGLAMGMSLEGFRPILFFERHDFIHNALDALCNQLDKIEALSQGEFHMPVIIRAVAGSVRPFYAGLTHTSNLTDLFRCLFSFPVYAPENSSEVLDAYCAAAEARGPVLISEKKSLYDEGC